MATATLQSFDRLAQIFRGVSARQRAQQNDFLELHRRLVEQMPPEAAQAFGKMGVETIQANGARANCGIELTVADHLYWRNAFDDRVRFALPCEKVKALMLAHLARKIEAATSLQPDDKKAVLSILLDAEAGA